MNGRTTFMKDGNKLKTKKLGSKLASGAASATRLPPAGSLYLAELLQSPWLELPREATMMDDEDELGTEPVRRTRRRPAPRSRHAADTLPTHRRSWGGATRGTRSWQTWTAQGRPQTATRTTRQTAQTGTMPWQSHRRRHRRCRHYPRGAPAWLWTPTRRCALPSHVTHFALRKLNAPPIQVYAVAAFLGGPQGDVVATGGEDDTARLWPVQGTGSRALSGHTDSVAAVAFRCANGAFNSHPRLPPGGNSLPPLQWRRHTAGHLRHGRPRPGVGRGHRGAAAHV